MVGAHQYHISVCICTYNRAKSLGKALTSLAAQQGIENLNWELLVIDNNSSDATAKIAKQYETSLPLRYVFEPIQGLSAARNRALREFKAGTLVFTDDDVVLDERWLASFVEALCTFPDAEFFGGRILPCWDDKPPGWLKDPTLDLISGLLVRFDLGNHSRLMGEGDPLPFGASFALRRSLIESNGRFRVDLGVKGGDVGRGEETEYLNRARKAGATGAYVGRAACFHAQHASKFFVGYLYRYGIETGRAERLTRPAANGSLLSEITFLLRGAVQVFKGRGDRFRQCVINAGIQRGLRAGTTD